MPVYRLTDDAIVELPKTSYADQGIKERRDLQRLLKDNIAVVAPDVLVISEEFGDWDDSKRRIDLLGIDRDATLVVIELKRDEEGGHMELQAIRYAAMVSRMTFQRAVKTYQTFLDKSGSGGDGRAAILKWVRTNDPPRDDAVLEVRIVLVAADFKKELTTAVLWLREWELDIDRHTARSPTCDNRRPRAERCGPALVLYPPSSRAGASALNIPLREAQAVP